MYEIWLGLNIFFEMALAQLPLVAGYALLWLALMASALLFSRGALLRMLPFALIVGVVVLAVGFVLLPGVTHSAFANMGYWLDWAALLGAAAACAVLVTALVWPALALTRAGR